jgi:phosphoserine phosphatase
MDVDSTLITAEVIELLAARAGSADQVADLTERAMRGELDFAGSLRARVATLAGLPVGVFADVLAEIRLTPGAVELLDEMAARAWPVALVSGGFLEVVGPLATRLGVTRYRANGLEVADGFLTGRVRGPVIDRAAKAAALRTFAASEDIPMAHTIAIGDGANDLDMLADAGFGIAFNARPILSDRADAVVCGRLDAVLTLEPFQVRSSDA